MFGCPMCPSARVDGIVCAPNVVICIREQRFPSHVKPSVFLEQHGTPGAALPSALMNSSRGIPGLQAPLFAPSSCCGRCYHPARRARGGREQSGRHSPPHPAHSTVELHVGDAPHAMGNQRLPTPGASRAARGALDGAASYSLCLFQVPPIRFPNASGRHGHVFHTQSCVSCP